SRADADQRPADQHAPRSRAGLVRTRSGTIPDLLPRRQRLRPRGRCFLGPRRLSRRSDRQDGRCLDTSSPDVRKRRRCGSGDRAGHRRDDEHLARARAGGRGRSATSAGFPISSCTGVVCHDSRARRLCPPLHRWRQRCPIPRRDGQARAGAVSTVAVVTSSPPFVEGGHLIIARALVTALRNAGHTADVVLTPQNRFGRQAAAYAATWLTDVGQTADGRNVDQVISLRFPSYAIRHPRHVCWLNHTMREYYDLWPAFRAQLSSVNQKKEGIRRRLIHGADRYLLGRNVNRLFVQSETIRRRLSQWPEVRAEVSYPPPPPRPYRV